jgi:hypothetical protein
LQLQGDAGEEVRDKLVKKTIIEQKTGKQMSLAPFVLAMEEFFKDEYCNLAVLLLKTISRVRSDD